MDIIAISFMCAVIGLISTFCSAICFSPSLFTSKEKFEKISYKCLQFGVDSEMLKRLLKEQKYARIGFFFLTVGVFFQMLSLFLQNKQFFMS